MTRLRICAVYADSAHQVPRSALSLANKTIEL